jgi:hypothetical protein
MSKASARQDHWGIASRRVAEHSYFGPCLSRRVIRRSLGTGGSLKSGGGPVHRRSESEGRGTDHLRRVRRPTSEVRHGEDDWGRSEQWAACLQACQLQPGGRRRNSRHCGTKEGGRLLPPNYAQSTSLDRIIRSRLSLTTYGNWLLANRRTHPLRDHTRPGQAS